MAGMCLRWTERCNDVLSDLQCFSRRSGHDLAESLHSYYVTCYASLDGLNPQLLRKTAEKAGFHLVWQSRTAHTRHSRTATGLARAMPHDSGPAQKLEKSESLL
jgi:hypothetical protein